MSIKLNIIKYYFIILLFIKNLNIIIYLLKINLSHPYINNFFKYLYIKPRSEMYNFYYFFFKKN